MSQEWALAPPFSPIHQDKDYVRIPRHGFRFCFAPLALQFATALATLRFTDELLLEAILMYRFSFWGGNSGKLLFPPRRHGPYSFPVARAALLHIHALWRSIRHGHRSCASSFGLLHLHRTQFGIALVLVYTLSCWSAFLGAISLCTCYFLLATMDELHFLGMLCIFFLLVFSSFEATLSVYISPSHLRA